MTPNRRRSRKSDKFLAVCATLGLVSAIVVGLYVGPVLLDTSNLSTENQQRIKDVARLTRENQQATQALCVFRADLQARVDAGNEFLAGHPDGIAGIPAKQFRTSLDNQQRTITALRGLPCPAPK